MNKTFGKLPLASLILLVLASFALTPAAEARGARGGGGGGGARASAQPSMNRADARSTDVRSTSVNNVNSSRSTSRDVNIDRDVNVDIDVDGDYHGGWDHPVAGAMVVGGAMAVTAAAIGSIVYSVPPSCVPVNYGGMVYQQCGSTWYLPQGSQFVVVNPPY
jgi:hypothetical protein